MNPAKPSFAWLLPLGFVTLIIGMLAGLKRLGLDWPAPSGVVGVHGLVMVSGFLGLLIGAERAVALGRAWAWSVPLLGLAGTLAWIFNPAANWGWLLYTLEAALFAAVALRLRLLQNTAAMNIMLVGALCWLAGNATWHWQGASTGVVLMWAGFPLWTVLGERVELSGGARVTTFGWWALAGLGLAYGLGMMGFLSLAGLSLLAMGAWLLRYDVARLHLESKGEKKFMAWCLLAAYAWLAIGGVVALAMALGAPGPRDAWMHCIFLGFLFCMIFGHITLVFPALTGKTLPWHPAFYVHLLVLQVSLLMRVIGSLEGWPGLRQAGGLLNALAIVIFLINNAFALRKGWSTKP